MNASKAKDESGKSGDPEVVLQGALTVARASEIKLQLQQALAADKIVVRLQDVTQVDIAFLQLLQSVEKSCEEEGKELQFEGRLPEGIVRVIGEAGLDRYFPWVSSAEKSAP